MRRVFVVRAIYELERGIPGLFSPPTRVAAQTVCFEAKLGEVGFWDSDPLHACKLIFF